MARISGADPGAKSIVGGLFVRGVYAAVKRRLGKVVTPVRIVAHHSRILWGYVQMELAFQGSRQVEHSLKVLAEVRAATLIGCHF